MLLQVILEGIGLGVLLILVCAIGIRKGAVGDEALHVLRRVAEKQPHLVRKLSALASFECLLVSIL